MTSALTRLILADVTVITGGLILAEVTAITLDRMRNMSTSAIICIHVYIYQFCFYNTK